MKKSLFTLILVIVTGMTGLWAHGQQESPPVIPLEPRTPPFVAPGNPEAAQKSLTVPFTPQAAPGQVIKAWTFTVYDTAGQVVWTLSKTETRDRGFFAELFNLGPRPQVEVPPQLAWDGTFAKPGTPDNGKPVPNGVYTYVVTVTDSTGTTARTPPLAVTVQNSPVAVTRLVPDYTIFSPQGSRPTVTIRQAGTREARWEGTFTDAGGKVVRTLVWANPTDLSADDPSPADFIWDGKDGSGQVLPEGEYRYTLKGSNRAGATASRTLDQPLVISERPGVLRLSSDQQVFSPKAEAPWSRTLALKTDSGNAGGLTEWTVTVTDPGHPKAVLWSKGAKGPLPDVLTFDGMDQAGRPLADGHYQAVLTANFNNGNAGESPALGFDLKTAPPQGTLQAPASFGGTGRPSLPVTFTGAGNTPWVLSVAGPDGKVVRTLDLGTQGRASAEIPGADAGGFPLPDGTYTLQASAHDPAGNLGTALLTVVRDTRPRPVSLNSSSPVLVPGNSANGQVTVTPVLTAPGSVVRADWTLSAVGAKGTDGPVIDRKTNGADVVPYGWSGKDPGGKALADGPYRITLEVTYANGTVSRAQNDLKIDSNYLKEPQGVLTVSAPVFGGTDRPGVTAAFQGVPGISWTLSVADSQGKVLGTYPLGSTGSGSLDLPAAGSPALPDGVYTLKASAVSQAGVPGASTVTVKKDSRPRKAALDLSRTVLVPGKGADGQVRITPILDLTDGIEGVDFQVSGADKTVLARQTRDGPMTFWDWNGLGPGGKAPADGALTVDLAVRYANGTTARASADLKVDSTYLTEPQGTLTVTSPVFGSPARPTVPAVFTGDQGTAWTLEVVSPAGKVLRTYPLGNSGRASADIGTDTLGKPLPDGTYTLRASARNAAGLQGTATTSVTKDTRPAGVRVSLSSPVLVPGSGLNGSVRVTPVLEVLDSITATDLTLTGPDGTVVDQKTWGSLVPFWDWSGTDALGKAVPDGTYRVALAVSYANGARNLAAQDIRVDSSYLKEPRGTLTASNPVFGGPGRAGVTVSFQGDSGIPWVLEILGSDGKAVRQVPLGTTGTASVDFRGLDAQDQPLPDGPYTLKASAVSPAGVQGTALVQLRKDSRQGKTSLDLSRTVIVPGKGTNGTVRITPILEVVDSVEKTDLTILGPDGKTAAERSENGMIPFWDWTGQDSRGKNLADGTYQVALTVSYANGAVTRAQGGLKVDSAYLNDQGPLVDMALSTKSFAPDNVDGPTDLTVTIRTTEGAVPVSGWQMTVLDPRGKPFRQWVGQGIPPKTVFWDGKADSGDLVESGEDYQIQLKVSDIQGHVTRKQDSVTTDISVVKLAEGKYKIVVSSIQFAGYSSDVFQVQGDLLTKNLFVLKRLANALGKFPGYKIRLEGYAVSEYWNDPKTADWEQKTQLLPLSLARAQAVRNVMVLLGIEPERFTVQGYGGLRPVVPHSDLENRWKNRRVEFYLDKN